MEKDYSDWVEDLAESNEFAEYVCDNLQRETIEALLEKFAELKMQEADDYRWRRD